MLEKLQGKKTYATGGALIILGILKAVLPDIPVEANTETLIGGGLMGLFLRAGIAHKK